MALTRPRLTQINTDVTKFDDPIIELNAALTGANATDIGIVMNRGTSGDNVGIFWDSSNQQFALVETTADGDSTGDLVYTSLADLQVNSISTAGFSLPSADGTLGQIISTDGNGVLSWVDAPASDLVEDTTPQLGGNLDVNGFQIVGAPAASPTTSGGNINITAPQGGSTSGSGGDITLTGGAGFGTGYSGDVTLAGGAGNVSPARSGHVILKGGIGGNNTDGGDITITAGSIPRLGNADGGHIHITPGGQTTVGTSSKATGTINIHGGVNRAEQGALRFWNDTDTTHTTGNYVELQAPATTSNRTWVLPDDDPATANGQFLTTDGSGNLSFGNAGLFDEDANRNIFGGASAGATLSGLAVDNFFAGVSAGSAVTSGDKNLFIGTEAGLHVAAASQNLGIGYRAIGGAATAAVLTGANNVALGAFAGQNLEGAATENILIGRSAGGIATTGSQNVLIGDTAGLKITTGVGNVCVGNGAGPTGNQSNQLYIHNVESNTPLIHGDFSTSDVTINGDLAVTGLVTGTSFNGVALTTLGSATQFLAGDGNYQTLVESDISDLQSYLLNITGESISSLSDVNVTTPAARHAIVYDGVDSWDNRLLVEADISDLQAYLTAEVNDLTASVTWANVPIANIPTGTTGTTVALGDHTHPTLYQPLDTDLTNIAALTGTSGFLKTDGANVWSVDTSTYLTAEVNDLTSAVTWANVPIANIPTGTTGTTVALGDHLHTGTYQPLDTDLTNIAALTGTSGFLKTDGANIWSVDTSTYLTAEVNDLTSAVTWANVPDANITQTSVTQHQAALSITESQISDLGTYIPATEKGAVNGVATLNASGLIPDTQVPQIAITSTYVAVSELAQLALTVQEGDICVRSDENKSYVALNASNTTMADWQVLLTPTDAVLSVDGLTGAVDLSSNYAPLSHTHTKSEITDFNEADYATGAEGDLATTAMQDLVDDASPTLGGILDPGGFHIYGANSTTSPNLIIRPPNLLSGTNASGNLALYGGTVLSSASTLQAGHAQLYGGSSLLTTGAGIGGRADVQGGGATDSADGIGGTARLIGGNGGAAGGVIQFIAGRDVTDGSNNGNIEIFLNGTGAPPTVKFFEDSTNGTNYVGLKAPSSATNTVTWTLPQDTHVNADGKFLTSDASGNLSFASVVSSPGGTDNQIQFNNGGVFAGSANLTWDDTEVNITGNIDIAQSAASNTILATYTGTAVAGSAVFADSTIAATNAHAVYARNNADNRAAVYAQASRNSGGTAIGVQGFVNNTAGVGVAIRASNSKTSSTVDLSTDTNLILGNSSGTKFTVTNAGAVLAVGGVDKLTSSTGTVTVTGNTPALGQVLKATSTTAAEWQDVAGDLFDDKSPQLGANLDVNGFEITSATKSFGTNEDVDTIVIKGGGNGNITGYAAGSVDIIGGNAQTGGAGGSINLTAGTAPSGGAVPGSITLTAGHTTVSDGNPGNIHIFGGNTSYSSVNIGGEVNLTGGLTDDGTGGPVIITGGTVRLGGTGTGGSAVIRGGDAEASYQSGNVNLEPGGGAGNTGHVTIHSGVGQTGQAGIQLWNDTNIGHTTGNYIELKAGAMAANRTITLPIDAPANGDVLTTTSAGVTSWEAPTVPASATTTTEGIVELATEAEVDAGTDTARAVTPATLQKKAEETAMLMSVVFGI